MIWIIVVVLVCEVVIMLKLLLSYRTRAHRMFLVQDPLKQRIKKHQDTLVELGQQIRGSSEEGVSKLENRMAAQTVRCGYAGNTAAELDAEAHEPQGVEEPDPDDDEEEEETGDGIVGKVGGLVESDDPKSVRTVAISPQRYDNAEFGFEQWLTLSTRITQFRALIGGKRTDLRSFERTQTNSRVALFAIIHER